MKKPKIDGMLLATLITTMFYSATYPYIHKEVVTCVSETIIALSQIVNCLSVIAFGSIWNKAADKLFKWYPAICIAETLLGVGSSLLVTLTQNVVGYYIADTLIFAMVTRNIICGGVKLKSMRYPTEETRMKFDNNNNSMSAIATIIGSIAAMMLDLDFIVMLWIATCGNAVDNAFYIYIYYKTERKNEHESKS